MTAADHPVILLYGGSFNPIHHGHLIVASRAAEAIGAQRVVLLPCATPPHKPVGVLAPAAQRLEMCRRATAGDSRFEVDDWETRQSGANYTLLTVQHFQAAHPHWRLHWLIGMDSLLELHTWHRAPDLVEACTLVTVARPGFEPGMLAALRPLLSEPQIARLLAHVLATPPIGISASDIRRRISQGASIRYLTPDSVVQYIHDARLYVSASV